MSSNPIKGAARWNGKVGGQNYSNVSPSEMARRNAAYSKSEAAAHQLDARVRAVLNPYGVPNLGVWMAAAREMGRIIKGHNGPTLILELTAIANKYIDTQGFAAATVDAMVLGVFGISLGLVPPAPPPELRPWIFVWER